MHLELITPPATDPLSLAEACAHIKVDPGDDDATVQALITAARQYLDGRDGVLGRALVTQTWRATMASLPPDGFALPLAPVQSVVTISYIDQAGTTQTLPATAYSRLGEWVFPAVGATWPTPYARRDAVQVEFIAGYAEVPEDIRLIMQLLIGHWYENREAVNVGNIVSEVPFAAGVLIDKCRRTWVG